jgi:signal transduction histidine kinase
MTHSAVSAPVRPLPSIVPAQVARGGQSAVRPTVADHGRQLLAMQLAMQLHDGPIQEVLAAGLAIDSCLADVAPGTPLHARLEDAKQLTATAVRHLRSSLQDLREGAGTHDQDLPEMLRRLEVQHPARQLDVSVEVTGVPVPLAPTVRRALFQVASECVFNAALHGKARRAVIRLSHDRGAVALCVADDGHGKPRTLRKIIRGEVPGTGGGYHLGLADIAARAREMGWTLRADRSDLGGIAIRVVLAGPASGDGQGARDE